jgi:hypothetical protein
VKATMRTDGRVNKTSIWGSGLDASLALGTEGRLKVRRATGVAGVEEAIASFSSSCNPLYCLITMVVQSKIGGPRRFKECCWSIDSDAARCKVPLLLTIEAQAPGMCQWWCDMERSR